MRHLKEVYPEYADRVAVLAVDVDPLESTETILSYMKAEGFSWPMTATDVEVVRGYNVTRQAAYVTLDSNGVVLSSVKYGSENAADWRELFERRRSAFCACWVPSSPYRSQYPSVRSTTPCDTQGTAAVCFLGMSLDSSLAPSLLDSRMHHHRQQQAHGIYE